MVTKDFRLYTSLCNYIVKRFHPYVWLLNAMGEWMRENITCACKQYEKNMELENYGKSSSPK